MVTFIYKLPLAGLGWPQCTGAPSTRLLQDVLQAGQHRRLGQQEFQDHTQHADLKKHVFLECGPNGPVESYNSLFVYYTLVW